MTTKNTAKRSDNKNAMASKNTHPTGIDKEKVKERTEKLATKLFPKETYNAYSKNIKIAQGREPKSKNDRQKLEKEIEMAEIAEKFGHYSILLPEKKQRQKLRYCYGRSFD